MDLISPNLNLPYLAPAQAQKHVTHNEALRQLDAIVQLSVSAITNTVPNAPENGYRLIVGNIPEGLFEGHPNKLAAFQDGAWAFYPPKKGWRAYVENLSELHIFDGTNWETINNSGANTGSGNTGGESIETIDKLGINTVADTINRLSVKSPNTLLDNEGAGHQLKLNKASVTDTASLLFQSGYTGHAEMGLTGGQNFHIKTSPDGNQFEDSLIAHADTGAVSFPKGINPDQMTTAITASGGPEAFYGLPNLTSSYYGRNGLPLTQNRMYFSSFYVDRPSELRGGFVAQYANSTTTGAVMRAGIFELGQANGDNWALGDRIVDLGTQSADIAGHKDFELTEYVTLAPGWYVAAIGTDGSGIRARYARTLQPGSQFLLKQGNATSTDIRAAGCASYLYSNSAQTEITNGLSETWPNNPVTDFVSSNLFGYLLFFPKWTMWA